MVLKYYTKMFRHECAWMFNFLVKYSDNHLVRQALHCRKNCTALRCARWVMIPTKMPRLKYCNFLITKLSLTSFHIAALFIFKRKTVPIDQNICNKMYIQDLKEKENYQEPETTKYFLKRWCIINVSTVKYASNNATWITHLVFIVDYHKTNYSV